MHHTSQKVVGNSRLIPVISFFCPHQCKSTAYAFCSIILTTTISPCSYQPHLSYVGLCDYYTLTELFSAEDAFGSVTKLYPTHITLLSHICFWFFLARCICLHFFHLTELFSECYSNSEERAFSLLVRKSQYWSKTTCLHLATEADAKSFFAHDGVQVTSTGTSLTISTP